MFYWPELIPLLSPFRPENALANMEDPDQTAEKVVKLPGNLSIHLL